MVLNSNAGDRALAISDGHAGNARQALALASALAPGAPRELLLAPRAPWRWLAPRRLPGDAAAFGDGFAGVLDAPPPLAVGCGRQAALATRILRGRGARVVQVLDPRLAPRHWDVVVAPAHDGLAGPNVVTVTGSLHPVDEAWLRDGRDAFPGLGDLPGPRVAVLLGGPSRHAGLDVADFEDIASAVEAMAAREGGSVLLTTSRRTPAAVRQQAGARDWRVPAVAWTGGDRNPYAGMLGWADRIACTADSVNMLSEACATRAPVFVHRPGALRGRPRRFLDELLARGRVRPLTAAAPAFDAEPLRETARVAAEVRARLGLD
ncbi:MAG: nucleoside-diphosphate sugar epimerase [Gammaproteobacteria bacterium]|jgi:mitochondrial fission protein ELM1|nr:nucleoside-diphosphate sugar epimerase [Gammaproteobacteria bacterium]